MADQAKANFYEVSDFKSKVASIEHTLEVLRNKATDKLFMSIGGQNYRVQGDIDSTKPIKVLVPVVDGIEDWDNSCLVNIDPSKGAEAMFLL